MEKAVRIVRIREEEELDIPYWKKAKPDEKLSPLQTLREFPIFRSSQSM